MSKSELNSRKYYDSITISLSGLNVVGILSIKQDISDKGNITARKFPLVGIIAFSTLFVAVILGLLIYFDTQEQVLHLLKWLDTQGVWALVLFTLIMAVAVVLLLPGVMLTTGAGFVFGVVFCTRSGMVWLDIVDNWMSNYGLVLVGLMECIAVGYFFDLNQLKRYVNSASEINLESWFDLFVNVVTPAVLIYLLGRRLGADLFEPYEGYYSTFLLLAGWGVFFLLMLWALVLGRNWQSLIWIFSWVFFFGFFWTFLRVVDAAAMGALGG